MSANQSVGILGIGSFLPPEVRTNDWWPESQVRKWSQTAIDSRPRIEEALANAKTDGQRRVLAAMLGMQGDPFRGVERRHVMDAKLESSAMEIEAARSAIADAGITAADVDFLLVGSMVPDDLMVPNAMAVHAELGLAESCFATSIEATCNSFLMQLALAEQLVAGGRYRFGLLVQSCALSRILEAHDPQSAWYGDAATAVVVGRVEGTLGIRGRASLTDSKLRNAVVTGVPGKKWYDEGRSYFHARDRKAAYEILLGFADYGKHVVDRALEDAKMSPVDVTFFACHQAQLWQRQVAQDYAGLHGAKYVDTFAWAGNVGSANIPLILQTGEREGLLKPGDVVAMYGGGAGVTVSGVVANWGRKSA